MKALKAKMNWDKDNIHLEMFTMYFMFLLVTQLWDNCVGRGEKCGGLFGCLGFKLGFHSFFVALISSLAWGFRRFNHTPFYQHCQGSRPQMAPLARLFQL